MGTTMTVRRCSFASFGETMSAGRVADFGSLAGDERNQPDLVPAWISHHVHSSSSNLLRGKASTGKESLAAEPAAAKAFFQPWRGARSGAITRRLRST